ncbi:uncharacterized protein LOC130788848 [Actinidia eriantha]|uniref:uncharacterized protein LOC130788848 n=1 Tax=Actinidia eriantha TaxID=165200 RepID=UPI00258B16AA|nr:uncharacterized protein LOC130788848 [Actinidia eriantha]
MTKKNVRGKNKSNDEASKKDDCSSNIAETVKDSSGSGGSERVSKPRKTAKRGKNSDENPKGKKPTVNGRKVTTNEMDKERKAMVKKGASKRKVMADEGKAEMGKSPAKRSTNAGENDKGKRISGKGNIGEKSKGKRISGVRDWVLKPHNPREGNGNIGEKWKGKGKGKIRLVVEEGNAEESKSLRKRRRNADKKIPSFQRVGSSESGFSRVVRKRVKKPSAGESSRKVVPKEETVEKVKGRKSKKKNSMRGLGAEETNPEWNMNISGVVKLDQMKKLVNPREKMATKSESQKRENAEKKARNVASKKKISDGVLNEKPKPLKKTKKDEGELNVEKRENSAKNGQSNSKRK